MNWFAGRPVGTTSDGAQLQTDDGLLLHVPPLPAGDRRWDIGVRPERVTMGGTAPATAAGVNCLPGAVSGLELLGADFHYRVTLASGQRLLVVEKNLGSAQWSPGEHVTISFDAGGCIVLPAEPVGSKPAVTVHGATA